MLFHLFFLDLVFAGTWVWIFRVRKNRVILDDLSAGGNGYAFFVVVGELAFEVILPDRGDNKGGLAELHFLPVAEGGAPFGFGVGDIVEVGVVSR